MPSESSEHAQHAFTHIHAQELLEIKTRREKQSYDTSEIDPAQPDLVGLALSGGGIRSATFCLGFLQELHRLRLLRIFDYLSTVSGGGYLGGWWSAWLSRHLKDPDEIPKFNPEDIHDPVSLLKRSLQSNDPIARDFLAHLQSSARGQKLLSASQHPNPELTNRLYEPLAEELTAYIDTGKTPEERWERKLSLLDTFPCELRDIFPPLEQIEPERESDKDATQRGSEGSRCAWKDPIHHLRLFANYLTPRKGILSADTWRAISVVSRNLILTWLIMVPLLAGVMLLGQAYFFLNPASQKAFKCVGAECLAWNNQQPVLLLLLAPIAVLLISSVVMAIAWLLSNRDSSSSLDWIIQWACLLALAALLVAGVFAIPFLRTGFTHFFALPGALWYVLPGLRDTSDPQLPSDAVMRLRFTFAWFLLLLFSILIMWHWGLSDYNFADGEATPEALSSWKREVRRGRFSRVQSKLLVTTAVVAAVLLLSWVSCLFTREDGMRLRVKIPVALVPLLSAVGGSIFTAMRAAPVPADDEHASRRPSWISRFVFAVTPSLVVGVLAVTASAIVHGLLLSLSDLAAEPESPIYGLLTVAAILSIGLCIGLAIYELEGVQTSKLFTASVPSATFFWLVLITVSWGAQAIFLYGHTNAGARWRYLLITSVSVAVLIIAVVIAKLIVDRSLRKADSKAKNVPAGLPGKALGATAIIFIALITVGVISALLIYFKPAENFYLITAEKFLGKISRALVLTLIAMAGGVILFRVLVSRINKNQLKSRVLGENRYARRPESLWVTASSCLLLPIVLIGVGHHLVLDNQTADPGRAALLLFPVCIAGILLPLMILRALVIQKQVNGCEQVPPWYGGIFQWLFKPIPKDDKTPPNRIRKILVNNERRAYQLLALAAICLISLLDVVIRGLSPGELPATLTATPANWKLLAVAFVVSLPVFGVSIFQNRINAPDDELRFKKPLPAWALSQPLFWSLATLCVVAAAVTGLLLPSWLTHVSHIPSERVNPILLPVAAACFLIVLLEFFWSEGDSLPSLLLAAFGYLVVTSIFFLQLADASSNWYLVLGLLVAICVWVGSLGWMVDPNQVSMHQFYKARLVRAYLGASNKRRFKLGNKEITDAVGGDDLPLKSLINCDRGGPYHLINTTLNLSAGRDLATAQRSAASFVLSQKYCGSNRTKYCLTHQYMNGQLTLGTAVATSGAAVSPSMGAKKPTSALAMLLTLLNVRLGYWAPTPHRKGWNSSQPRLWPFYLVREFLSQTNDLSDYCYLTDGGHFDNTGLYSLIERGCRFVVLVDCGADPKPAHFEDLGEAIRRCRIDFGTEINLKLDPFLNSQPAANASCFVVGKIKFSEKHLRKLALAGKGEGYGRERDEWKQQGIIVYVKPSLIPNSTADVRGYGFENKFFPQQPTTNQWFGEAQFESYRRLGQTCAHSAFGQIKSIGLENRGRISLKKIQTTFFDLYKRAHK